MNKYIKAFLIAIVLTWMAGVSVLVHKIDQIDPSLGDGFNGIAFTTIGTSSPMTVTTTSSQLLATSTDAQWRLIQNNGATTIFLNFQADKAAIATSGVAVYAGTSLQLNNINGNMYTGAIRAISPSGSVQVMVNQR